MTLRFISPSRNWHSAHLLSCISMSHCSLLQFRFTLLLWRWRGWEYGSEGGVWKCPCRFSLLMNSAVWCTIVFCRIRWALHNTYLVYYWMWMFSFLSCICWALNCFCWYSVTFSLAPSSLDCYAFKSLEFSVLLLQLFIVILVTKYMSFHISLRILTKIPKNYFGSFRINVLFYSASLL